MSAVRKFNRTFIRLHQCTIAWKVAKYVFFIFSSLRTIDCYRLVQPSLTWQGFTKILNRQSRVRLDFFDWICSGVDPFSHWAWCRWLWAAASDKWAQHRASTSSSLNKAFGCLFSQIIELFTPVQTLSMGCITTIKFAILAKRLVFIS